MAGARDLSEFRNVPSFAENRERLKKTDNPAIGPVGE